MRSHEATGARIAPAVLVLLLGLSLRCGERLPLLTPEILDTQRRLWAAQGITSYDLEVIVTGTGLEAAEPYHLEVRDDRVARAESGGRAMSGNVASWTVPGLFTTLADECELARNPERLGAPPGYQVYLQARFDPVLGYPVHFRRQVGGSNRKVEIRVTRFERR
jgi:hypothetical protein